MRRGGLIPLELGVALDTDFEALIPKALEACEHHCVWWTRAGDKLINGKRAA